MQRAFLPEPVIDPATARQQREAKAPAACGCMEATLGFLFFPMILAFGPTFVPNLSVLFPMAGWKLLVGSAVAGAIFGKVLGLLRALATSPPSRGAMRMGRRTWL